MVFLDSNIWIYSFVETQDPRKHRIACELVGSDEIAISVQVIAETCRTLLRKMKADEHQIRNLIADFEAQYSPLALTTGHLSTASALRSRYKFSFWDSCIVTAALELEAGILYSEDMQDGLRIEGKLLIMNPFTS